MSYADMKTNGHRGLKGLFLNNYGLKILAIIFSALLWYLVVGEQVIEVGMPVSLGLKDIPENMIVVGKPQMEVEVTVSGPENYINKLSPADISGVIDLTDGEAGKKAYRVYADNISAPGMIRVARIRPSYVNIRLESLVRTVVPVKVRLKGKVAEGYEISGESIVPKSVEIVGIEKQIKKIKNVSTEEVDVSGLDSGAEVDVLLDTAGIEIAGVDPESVSVKIEIVKSKKKISKRKKKK